MALLGIGLPSTDKDLRSSKRSRPFQLAKLGSIHCEGLVPKVLIMLKLYESLVGGFNPSEKY